MNSSDASVTPGETAASAAPTMSAHKRALLEGISPAALSGEKKARLSPPLVQNTSASVRLSAVNVSAPGPHPLTPAVATTDSLNSLNSLNSAEADSPDSLPPLSEVATLRSTSFDVGDEFSRLHDVVNEILNQDLSYARSMRRLEALAAFDPARAAELRGRLAIMYTMLEYVAHDSNLLCRDVCVGSRTIDEQAVGTEHSVQHIAFCFATGPGSEDALADKEVRYFISSEHTERYLRK